MRASLAGFTIALICSTSAQAALVISTNATSNVTCSAGVCSATAADAVLNVGDVTTLLASAPLIIQSGSQAQDILVEAPFNWKSSSALTLDSFRSVTIDKPVTDAGPAALDIRYDDGGTSGLLTFRAKGRIHFTSTKNSLTLNGQSFTLVNSVAALASAVSHRSMRYVALADNYDAAPDGAYQAPPVPTFGNGFFEGLGNSIFNLEIVDSSNEVIGLFGVLRKATVADLAIVNASVSGTTSAGILAGMSFGSTLRRAKSSGLIVGAGQGYVGGLIGGSSGLHRFATSILDCNSTANVQINGTGGYAGGLIGFNAYGGFIQQSFATGTVLGGANSFIGGLGGYSGQEIDDSYSTGDVKEKNLGGKPDDWVGAGGLVGNSDRSIIQSSYSIGAPSGSQGSYIGGFAGLCCASKFASDYWDKKTSETKLATASGEVAGIIGLTTNKLKSALPDGFDPTVWAEDPKINKGYPYLIANPPSK